MSYERDPEPLRAEALRLLEEVIAEHDDEPYDQAKGHTLGRKARDLFDDWANLAVGKQAPEIEGVDLDGKPLKLSDYRGKVTALVFWNCGCGPCLSAVPRERELVEKLKEKPFTILGVNTDEKPEAARKAAQDTKMTWRSFRDGKEGPILDRYHVQAFPTTFVIDAKGIIRNKNADHGFLEKAIEEILAEMEAKPAESK
jgi:peroxiredoxin